MIRLQQGWMKGWEVLLGLTILCDHRQDKNSHISFHKAHTQEHKVLEPGERDVHPPQSLHSCRQQAHYALSWRIQLF